MNKEQRIAEAMKKVEEITPEYNKICCAHKTAISNLSNAINSCYEVGDRVELYEESGNHGQCTDRVGSGEIIELIRYGGWYKVKLDSGEIRTFSSEFVSKINIED